MKGARDIRPVGDGAQPWLIAGLFASLLVCGGLLVYGSGRGFDLTDEAFYLIRTREPDGYALSYQPFGYLLHPLFSLAAENLQSFRALGFAIAACAGALLGAALPSGRPRRLFGLYGALASLTIFFPWIVTPSYNSAANIGALLVLAGVFSALRASPGAPLAAALPSSLPSALSSSLQIAAGLCLAAFGKPPLFAIAALAVALVALAAPRGRTALVGGLVIGAALICLVLPPGQIAVLVARMSLSQHVLGMPNTPLALPAKIVRDWLAVPPLLTAAALAAAFGLAFRRHRPATWLGAAAVTFSLAYVATIVPDAIDGEIPDFLGLALVLLAAGYAAIVRPRPWPSRLAVLVLLATPAAVALGTFNNQWFQLNFSMAFGFLALFALAAADALPWRRAAAQALALAGPAAAMLLAACHPYSLPASIFDQQVPITTPLARGPVLVDPQTAAFARAADGLASGRLVIDLSGTGPGVAVLMGGRAPVLPWLNPATPTWPDVVWSRLTPQAREAAVFVGPVWPAFAASQPARWFEAHRAAYCRALLPPMTFWGEARSLEVWRPCAQPAQPSAR
ncbi:hypothetical protein [Phenylobacterium soli]|uniref:Glycosyltransferase RgtA/B/C/D-like domain-containing protein n=1 Tax=Phenylobacterium soli TaxID=2170551 RepID=A0A328AIT4_9CAUL|nr:hypothetical protein [Phenylobacterium soli]RAK54417.1 hypothetical protein DJ017_07715 [Phenylobacterium soli]